jgi:Flp pilus assembly protein TadB
MSINDDKLEEYKAESLKKDTISLTSALIRLLQMILLFLWGAQVLDMSLLAVFSPTIVVFIIFCCLLMLFLLVRRKYKREVRNRNAATKH